MAVLLRDAAISVMDEQLRTLIAANRARNADGFLLCGCVFDGSFTAANFDIPAAASGRNNVMCFGHGYGSYKA